MKIRILLLFLAVIFGIAAVFGVMLYINSMRSKVETEGIKVEVLVANQDIPKDTPVEVMISNNMVEIEEIPQQFVVKDSLVSLEGFEEFLVATPINTGEQITAKKFISLAAAGFSLIIPEGMVAISIPINEVIGVSNLINIGDKVNVIATFSPGSEQEQQTDVQQEPEQVETVSEDGTTEFTQRTITEEADEDEWSVKQDITKTLLWGVEILYIGIRDKSAAPEEGQTQQDAAVETRTVTLALTPSQSEKLVFSDEFGKIRLALLPVDDSITEEDTGGMTFENIFK
jgi:Flp pilus assembly protein CpaB